MYDEERSGDGKILNHIIIFHFVLLHFIPYYYYHSVLIDVTYSIILYTL